MSDRPVVAVVGAGGIGHPAIAALASEAVSLRVIDDDRVEESNLHRLPFAREDDVGRTKADVALRLRNEPGDRAVATRVLPHSALEILAGASVVIEGSDNFATKFLVADACMRLGIPSVHGACVGWVGTVLAVVPAVSACYRCVFEDLPSGEAADCASAGVYGPVTSVIGALMAADALALLRGDTRFAGSVGSYDGLRNTFRSTRFARRSACALCNSPTTVTLAPERYATPICAA